MANKTNANIGFEKQLWDAACVLWGHIPAAEYRSTCIYATNECLNRIENKLGQLSRKTYVDSFTQKY